jgi:GT2 family glycosyltransferase
VVVSWNTRKLLEECLRSLSSASEPLEVIVVENGSSDGSADMVRQCFPEARLIENSDNRGFSAANNQGLAICSGFAALLLNSDTRVQSGASERMLQFLTSHPRAGMVGCRLVDAWGEVQPSASGLPGLWMQLASFLGLKRLLPLGAVGHLLKHRLSARLLDVLTNGYFTPTLSSTAPLQVDFLSGACLMVRREVWEEIGLLDESIFLFLEDADWCRRARDAGWELWFLPDLEVVHHGGASFRVRSGGRSHHISRERCASLIYYFEKHEPRWKLVTLRGVVLFALTARLTGLSARRLIRRVDKERYAADADVLKEALQAARNR